MDTEKHNCEQATGCLGAGDFREWAEDQGYPHCEVLNWSSSAGDWDFIVSRDKKIWYPMSQTNNWPRPGFTRHIDLSQPFEGTAEEVFSLLELLNY